MAKTKKLYQICLCHHDQQVTFVRTDSTRTSHYHIYSLTPTRGERIAQLLNRRFNLCNTPVWLNSSGWSVFPPYNPRDELETQVEAKEQEYLAGLVELDHADPNLREDDFDGYDPADAEFDRWARTEAPAEHAELEAEMELERLGDEAILDTSLWPDDDPALQEQEDADAQAHELRSAQQDLKVYVVLPQGDCALVEEQGHVEVELDFDRCYAIGVTHRFSPP